MRRRNNDRAEVLARVARRAAAEAPSSPVASSRSARLSALQSAAQLYAPQLARRQKRTGAWRRRGSSAHSPETIVWM